MGNTLTTTSTQRQEALQQLQAAFGQPNGSMFFTYNGHIMQTLAVNLDGTLRVQDLTTGTINNSIDPVDVYVAARAAYGDPVQTNTPTPPPPQSSLLPTIMNQTGQYVGVANLAVQTLGRPIAGILTTPDWGGLMTAVNYDGVVNGTRAWISAILNNPILGKVLGVAGAALSTYSAFTGAQSFYANPTGMGTFGLGMSAFGVATGVNTALAAFHVIAGGVLTNPAGWAVAGSVLAASFTYAGINDWITNGFSSGALATTVLSTAGLALSAGVAVTAIGLAAAGVAITGFTTTAILAAALTNPIGWAIAGAVVLFSVLWSVFHQPSPEEQALTDLNKALNPVIWSAWPVTFVAAGVVGLMMGWPKGSAAPIMSQLTLPASFVTGKVTPMNSSGPIPMGTGSVIVGQDGNIIVDTPAGYDSAGRPMMNLTSYVLSQNIQFVSGGTPPNGYIPFFVYQNGNPIPNPAVVKAMGQQQALLKSILNGSLNTQEALNAMLLAASLDKYGVGATN